MLASQIKVTHLAVVTGALLLSCVLFPDCGMCQRGRGNSDFFDALREAGDSSVTRDFFDLLMHEPVRAEIGLSQQDYQQIFDSGEKNMRALFDLQSQSRESGKSKDEYKKEILEHTKSFEEETLAILKKNSATYTRLLELMVQQKSFSAAANSEIAELIGLTDDQLVEFRSVRAELRKQQMEKMRPEVEGIIRKSHGDRHSVGEKIEKLFREANTELLEQLKAKLSEDQQVALEKLKGEKFDDLPAWNGFRRGMPGPPRRAGGRGRGQESRRDAEGPGGREREQSGEKPPAV